MTRADRDLAQATRLLEQWLSRPCSLCLTAPVEPGHDLCGPCRQPAPAEVRRMNDEARYDEEYPW